MRYILKKIFLMYVIHLREMKKNKRLLLQLSRIIYRYVSLFACSCHSSRACFK